MGADGNGVSTTARSRSVRSANAGRHASTLAVELGGQIAQTGVAEDRDHRGVGPKTFGDAQYFDPSSAEISADDSAWALSMARTVVEAVGRLLAVDPPDLFA